MKIIFNITSLLFLALLPACDFNDTNLDSTRAADAELKEILPSALAQTAHNLTSIGGRVTGTVIQHLTGIDAQPESYTQYVIDERTLDEFWQTGLYAGAMKDCYILIEKATESDQPHYRGIAKILMAINLNIATSFWGAVPYQEAFGGLDNLQPDYDSQEAIYQSIQQLLTTAINDLQKNPDDFSPQDDDLLFNGNTAQWLSTAKALQARYFLHLSQKTSNTPQNVLDAIESGAFNTPENEPVFPFGKNLNEANPLPLFCFERPDQLVLSDYLLELLTQTNDPRLHQITVLVEEQAVIFNQANTQLYWGQFDAPLPFISLTELKFIQAEALLRKGEFTLAESIFIEAVIAHLEQLKITSSVYNNFITEHIHFNNCPSFEDKLEWLIQQKHLALFAQNPIEAWNDYRRTGFPNLSTPIGANPSFNPSLVIPKRYLYPISERISNKENLDNAINQQGGHLQDITPWVFQ